MKSADIDRDGDIDLFVGARLIAGKYPFPTSSYLLINENGIFKKAPHKIAPILKNIGRVTHTVFSDIDADGDDDLLVVGEWMEIKVLENKNGIFEDSLRKFGIQEGTWGIYWSITASDIDKDGDDDYIIGNLGTNNKFKASKEHLFKLYANDFDNNGTNYVVLAKYYKGAYVPMRGKECTTKQMPYISEKYIDYHSFATSTLIDILPEEKVKSALVYEIKNFESIILINNKGSLIAQALLIEAQVSPIKSALVADFNEDGHKDIVLVGNHYGVEVETTRYDAGFRAVLLGDGKNNFNFSSPIKSGFYIPTDAREILSVVIQKTPTFVVTNNNDTVTVFQQSDR